MTQPEFSRMMPRADVSGERREGRIAADAGECAALAERFDLTAITALSADYRLASDERGILATGQIDARARQRCAISGEPFDISVSEPFEILFSAEVGTDTLADEEIELSEEDCDTMPMSGDRFDLGEAVAQSFFLALDPYAEGPQADVFRKRHDLSEPAKSGPFDVLAELHNQRDKK